MNSELIQQFEVYINKQDKTWLYKLLCIFGTKKRIDQKHETRYRTVYNNIHDFLNSTKSPDYSLAILRQHYIRELYLK